MAHSAMYSPADHTSVGASGISRHTPANKILYGPKPIRIDDRDAEITEPIGTEILESAARNPPTSNTSQ